MEITKETVWQFCEWTNFEFGMMDSRKALILKDGDFKEAKKYLEDMREATKLGRLDGGKHGKRTV